MSGVERLAPVGEFERLTAGARVVPVVVIEQIEHAVPLATALVAGGLRAIEVTFRTACAEEAIMRIASEVEGAAVGAGTVINPAQVQAATEAGARFLVSPGSTPALLDAMADSGLPHLPGAANASQVMELLDRGIDLAKLFPAEPLGGTALLKALAGPFPQTSFCPTGGISLQLAPEYLALPSVPFLGGTWMLPADAIAAGDWGRVETLARAAAAL